MQDLYYFVFCAAIMIGGVVLVINRAVKRWTDYKNTQNSSYQRRIDLIGGSFFTLIKVAFFALSIFGFYT